MEIKFEVLGKPAHQQRHRHFRRANFVQLYDPSKEDKHDFLSVAMNNKPSVPFDQPLEVTLDLFFPRPKSHYRTGKYAGMLKDNAPKWHIAKPDSDNLAKFVMDSLNKKFWRDDSIVCSLIVYKRYSETPRTEVTINTILDDCI
jgi:Holliday junction resolvase RusA-like endonuclease